MRSKRKVKRVASHSPTRAFEVKLWSTAAGTNLWHRAWEGCGFTHASTSFLKRSLCLFISFSTFYSSNRKPLYTGCRPSDHKGCRHPGEVLGAEDVPGACREGSRAMGRARSD